MAHEKDIDQEADEPVVHPLFRELLKPFTRFDEATKEMFDKEDEDV